jgi:hypothetical protein
MQVESVLRKFKIEARAEKTACPVAEKYRNKVVLFYEKGEFGYYKQNTNQIIPHTSCIMNPDIFDR